MKPKNAPNRYFRVLTVIIAIVVMAGSSLLVGPLSSTANAASPLPTMFECTPQVTSLTAGQTIVVGTLTMSNDGTNLYVQYDITQPCWTFGTLHLWAGTDFTLLPRSGGGAPIPGQFPYQADATGLTSYTFTIPLSALVIDQSALCGAQIYVVAHAEVGCNGKTETAFGGDTPGTGTNRWFFYTMYTICCETVPDPCEYICQTAFAKGGYVFTTDKKSNPEKLPSLNLTKNRWGWAINIGGDGTTTYDIWAGAGLNKIANGTKVGTLTVTKTGDQVTVSYDLTSPAVMEELHIYVGDGKPQTVAPGQYGYIRYFDPKAVSHTATFTVSDTDSDGIWIIAHAVVCTPVL